MISAYAHTLPYPEVKDQFYKGLLRILNAIPPQGKIVLLLDFMRSAVE